ncbi:MAG TPA: CBS domain-containing protein [Candidatus Polarisedimenticolaceae bacterium]|nr:CBS domain-containing protein [Candidatus Polarisedimenticolaceae bacterium]
MRILVEQVMTRGPIVIRRQQDVHELEKLLLQRRIHGVPVVDEDDRLVGVASQTDLLEWHFDAAVDGASFFSDAAADQAAARRGLRLCDFRSASVEEVMSPVVHCIEASRPVEEAASAMIRNQIHRLVVVDEGGRVIGVISAIDLLRLVPGAAELLA